MNEIIENIWNDLHEELTSFIQHRVKNEAIVKDILHDVFLKIINNAEKVTQAENIKQYIYGIARNTTIDHFRKASKITTLEKEYTYISEQETETFNSALAHCCMKGFINKLPEKYQFALIRSELDNISQKELAEELNISYSGTKSRVQRAKKKLKELLENCCRFRSDRYGNLIHLQEEKECICT